MGSVEKFLVFMGFLWIMFEETTFDPVNTPLSILVGWPFVYYIWSALFHGVSGDEIVSTYCRELKNEVAIIVKFLTKTIEGTIKLVKVITNKDDAENLDETVSK